jgi:predicted CoA-binding protein
MEDQVMSASEPISEFLSQRKLALVGISRSGKGFGNVAFRELRSRGYQVHPVHPQATAIEGHPCRPSLLELPGKVGGVVLVVPPTVTEQVVCEAVKAGIPRVWMQQGSESAEAIRYCEENGLQVISGQCILMFLEPLAFVHRLHRWIWRILGKLPR